MTKDFTVRSAMLLVRVSRPSRRMLSVGLESEFSLFQGWKGFLRFAPVYWLFVHKAIYPFSPHMCPAANMGDILNCIVTRIAVGLQVTGETLKHLFGNLPFTAGSVLIQRNVLFW